MTDTDTTDTAKVRPGVLRRLVAAVGRGLRAIFRPAVIVSLAAVVAAAALVVVAIEQHEQTDWQRRQTCLAWYQARSIDTAGLYAGDSNSEGTDQEVFDERVDRMYLYSAEAAVECGGEVDEDGSIDVPGSDRSLTGKDYERLVEILSLGDEGG